MDYATRDEIRSLCTQQSFERGVNYHEQGRVLELDIDGDEIRATVRGSSDYDVSIDVAGFDWERDVRERLRTVVEDCGLAQQLPDEWTFADIVV